MLRNILKNKATLLLGTSMLLLAFNASAQRCPYGQELVVPSYGPSYCADVDDNYYDYGYYAPAVLPFFYGVGWGYDDDWGHDGYWGHDGHDGHWGHDGHDGHDGHAHAAGAHGGGAHGGGSHGGGHGGHH